MTEPETRSNSFATLRLRFETKDGPRTIIMSNLSVRDAALIAATHRATGQHAEYTTCGALISLAEHMANRRPLKLVRQA
jgi:hypothetical protein